MKKPILLIAFFYFFAFTLYAQDIQNTISFQIGLQCEGTGTAFLPTVTFKEGETYEIGDWSIPSNSTFPQSLWNSIKGTQFKIEDGALDKDVTIMFVISGIDCSSGLYMKGKYGEKFFFNVNLIILINGQEQPTPYYFKNLKKCILRIPNSIDLRDFISNTGISQNSPVNFYYRKDNNFSNDDIVTIKPTDSTGTENSYYEVSLRHFSNVVGMEESSVTSVENSEGKTPANFKLEQNFPNPFNPSTKINYSLANSSFVEINVYNILGIKVENIVREFQNAGSHSISFNAAGIPSGFYVYELKAGNYQATKKMIYLK